EAVVLEPAPFRHGVIPGFLAGPAFTEALQDELLDLGFRERRNDLLSLRQSEELGASPEPHVAALRHALCEEFRVWLSAVTQIVLEPTIDISCAKYEYTDVLLCHDDELEGRRIAFILYLVPPWEKSDGGTLDLYSTDEHFQPQQITKSLVPSWNTLVFFEVSPVSFHQVRSCLLNADTVKECSVTLVRKMPGNRMNNLGICMTQMPDRNLTLVYLRVPGTVSNRAREQKAGEEDGLSLIICPGLALSDISVYAVGSCDTGPCVTVTCCPPLLQVSEVLSHKCRLSVSVLLLSNFTGLKLHFLAPSDENEDAGEGQAADTTGHSSTKPEQKETEQPANSNPHQPHQPENNPEAKDGEMQSGSGTPVCAGELRRWTHGHYTLVHDSQATEFALDLLFFCGCEDWDPEYGGFTSYIAKGEDEELLTVNPEDNCLALVYRDKETMKFVKYINHRSLARLNKHPNRTGFWDFSFVYYE
ncbi:OGFD1 hydroxylase, partial [Leiothrix lutea]|nr:OGFD1 hydroxylase [Leiothrix lutea]